MVVIQPKDKTTSMLSILYEGIEHTLIDQSYSKNEISHILNHVPCHELILLLGHGSDLGLFSRNDDRFDVFDRLIVYQPHAYYLRKHGCNIVGIWCNANLFAEKERLHGLFTGMIVTEMSETSLYGINTSQEELDKENVKLAKRLRSLLDENVPLQDIPSRILALDDVHSQLTDFNYRNFYYL